MKRLLIFAAVAVLTAGCGASNGETQQAGAVESTITTAAPTATTEPTHTVTGTFRINNTSGRVVDGTLDNCYGKNGMEDISSTTQVKVMDGSGSLLGVGQLGAGQQKRVREVLEPIAGNPYGVNDSYRFCVYEWSVPNIPDAGFYKIEISHRGELAFSRTDLEAKGWHVTSSIG